MRHARIQFDLDTYSDGSLHLNFFDSLGDVGDVYLTVAPDGTFYQEITDEDDNERLEPIPNIYNYLTGLYKEGQRHAR